MRKAKVGTILCLISSALAFALYTVLMAKLARSLTRMQELTFPAVYYPLLFGLDLLTLLMVFLRAHREKNGDAGKIERLLSSNIWAAIIFELYAILNLIFAVKMNALVQHIEFNDFYVPPLLVKGVVMAIIYQLQAAFCFVNLKRVARICVYVAMAALLIFVYRELKIVDNIDLLLSALMYSQGLELPAISRVLTIAALLIAECLLPLLRLTGLALYNTKNTIKNEVIE